MSSSMPTFQNFDGTFDKTKINHIHFVRSSLDNALGPYVLNLIENTFNRYSVAYNTATNTLT